MRAAWQVVCAKELTETLRDRRTLLMMIVVPVLLYPVLLVVIEQLVLVGVRNLERDAAPIGVMGEAPPDFFDLLEASEELTLVDVDGDAAEAIRSDSVAAVAVFGPDVGTNATRDVRILYDAASDRSNRGRAALDGLMAAWHDSVLAGRLDRSNLPRSFAAPIEVSDSTFATAEEVGGYTLGRILPLLLVVITLLGAFYPAIDLAAGEKERGTLETLLTAPVPATSVVAGKFVTVAIIGVTAAALNLGSMLLTFQTGALQFTSTLGLEVSLPWTSILVIFLSLVPLAVLFGALFLGIAVGSSSFKEAQNSLTPVYMIVLIPAMLPLFPGIEFGPLLALTPVAGVALLFRDIMIGQADPFLGALVLLSTSAFAAAALAFAARAFGSERVLFGGGASSSDLDGFSFLQRWRERRDGGSVPGTQAAVLLVAFIAVVFFWGGIQLQIRLGEVGIVASQWLLLALPIVAAVTLSGFDPVGTLSLRSPGLAGLAGGLVLMAGVIPLVWFLGWLQTFILPVPWELLEGLEQLVRADTVTRLFWLIFVLAVTPAICEELVFRGWFLGGTSALSPVRRIILTGVVFGTFHLSFETIIRFLPSTTLGIVIAWAVWRSGSLFVGMAMHFLNNATIVVLATRPQLIQAFWEPDTPPPLWLLPFGLLLAGIGVRTLLLPSASAREADSPPPEKP